MVKDKRAAFAHISVRAALVALSMLAAFVLNICAGQAASTSLGVNEVHLSEMPRDQWRSILTKMKAAGVGLLRISIGPDSRDVPEVVSFAHSIGIDVYITIPLSSRGFYDASAVKRAGAGPFAPVYPLSEISVDRFAAFWRAHLKEMSDRGAQAAYYEIGNEINSPGFNGDLQIGSGETIDINDCASVACGRVKIGFNRVLQILDTVNQNPAANSHIVIGAFSSPALSWVRNSRAGYVSESSAIKYFVAHAKGDSTGVYSIHKYTIDRQYIQSPAAVQGEFSSAINQCREQSGQPCWLSEWGVFSTERSCAVSEGGRRILESVASQLSKAMQAGALKGALYFDWDTRENLSLVRCGQVISRAPYLRN